MDSNHEQNARIFKAFCDENRLKVLARLRGGEKCACALIEDLGIGQRAISYHMKILVDSGIVSARQEGKWTHYSISESGCARAKELLNEITTPETEREENACSCK